MLWIDLSIKEAMEFENILLRDRIVFYKRIEVILGFGMTSRLVDVAKRLAADRESVLNDNFRFAFG